MVQLRRWAGITTAIDFLRSSLRLLAVGRRIGTG